MKLISVVEKPVSAMLDELLLEDVVAAALDVDVVESAIVWNVVAC